MLWRTLRAVCALIILSGRSAQWMRSWVAFKGVPAYALLSGILETGLEAWLDASPVSLSVD